MKSYDHVVKKCLKTQIEHLKEKITNWTIVTFKTSFHQRNH